MWVAQPRKIKARRGGGAFSRGNSVGYRQILSQFAEVKELQSIVKKCYSHFGRSNTAKKGREGGSTVGGPRAATSTFCRSHRGFTRQPVSPNVHNWHRRFKHHPNSTRRPPERERAKMEAGERKKGEILGGPAEGGPEGWCPEGWAPEGWGPGLLEVRRVQAQT